MSKSKTQQIIDWLKANQGKMTDKKSVEIADCLQAQVATLKALAEAIKHNQKLIADRDSTIASLKVENTAIRSERDSGWHLADDAARGLGVECDGDLGHEAEQIRKERDSMRESVEWFLQAFDMPHPTSTTLNSKSMPELRETFIAALEGMRKAATLGD